jgi:ribose/xylose/arabinose/galactoside ABC-type transport system permease subunit
VRSRSPMLSGVRRFGLGPLTAWAQKNGLFFALLILVVIFTAMSGRFLTASNFSVILLQVAAMGIVAVPGAMLLLAGYVDLSVGSVGVLSAVVFGQAMAADFGLVAALLAGVGAGVAWGALNGYLISVLAFSPIIVTLGGLAGARGLAELLTQGITTFGYGDLFSLLGNGKVAGVPVPVCIFGAVFLVGLHVWYRTPVGRHLIAIGGARETAADLGIAIRAIPFWLYVASSFAASVGGLIVASELDGAAVTIGSGMELEVLTAILLGGVSFAGGRGSLFGVLFGLLFMGVLGNGLVQVNVSPYFERVAIGIALVLAAGLDILYQRLERLQVPIEVERIPDKGTSRPAQEVK